MTRKIIQLLEAVYPDFLSPEEIAKKLNIQNVLIGITEAKDRGYIKTGYGMNNNKFQYVKNINYRY